MIHIYSKPACPACNRAKHMLEGHGLRYRESVIGQDILRETFVTMYPDVRTVPLILTEEADGFYQIIGGTEDLQRWLEDGKAN